MTKQTAVDFAFETLASQGLLVYKEYQNLVAYREAKEMEKEQKMNDFIAGMEFIAVDPNRYKEDAEQYYNETYGGNK
jgi:hypothetical protein